MGVLEEELHSVGIFGLPRKGYLYLEGRFVNNIQNRISMLEGICTACLKGWVFNTSGNTYMCSGGRGGRTQHFPRAVSFMFATDMQNTSVWACPCLCGWLAQYICGGLFACLYLCDVHSTSVWVCLYISGGYEPGNCERVWELCVQHVCVAMSMCLEGNMHSRTVWVCPGILGRIMQSISVGMSVYLPVMCFVCL